MMKHFVLLSGVLLLAIAGGCNKEPEEGNITGLPGLSVSFIDSEGQDLVAGIPAIKLMPPPAADFLSDDVFRIKVFINEEEIRMPNVPVRLFDKDSIAGTCNVVFIFYDLPGKELVDASNSAVYTVRTEIVCPYIFGNDEAHTLTGELGRSPGGYYCFRKCWFDGVEAAPTYAAEGWQREGAFTVRVDR
jgi:hypothetical protein